MENILRLFLENELIKIVFNSEYIRILIINFFPGIISFIINIFLITKILKLDFSKNKKIEIICFSIIVETITMLLVITPFYSFINIIFMSYLTMIILKFNFNINIKAKNLEAYNQTLELMLDSVKSFRHDYGNFLQALNGYAQTNNINGIKSMTSVALTECANVNNMGVLTPNTINNSAVYGILTNKYFLAFEKGITMNIEVMADISKFKICDYELCKILGILLDNAIEAASETKEKIVNVKFINDTNSNRNLIIIENSYVKVDINIDKIFEKGYTTKNNKEEEHGLGLWTIRRILQHSDNLNLFTSKSNLFSQQLEIYEK